MATTQKIVLYKTKAGNVHAAAETTTLTILKNVDDVLRDILDSIPLCVGLNEPDGLYLSSLGGVTDIIKRITKLRLKARYAVIPKAANAKEEDPPQVTISWTSSRNSLDSQRVLVWTPPWGAYLWFVTSMNNGSPSLITTWYDEDTEDADGKHPLRFARLPLGNIHPDGTLCMGEGYREAVLSRTRSSQSSIPDIVTFMQMTMDYFDDSMWNSDLITQDDIVKAGILFRWALPDLQQVPVSLKQFIAASTIIKSPFESRLAALHRMYIR